MMTGTNLASRTRTKATAEATVAATARPGGRGEGTDGALAGGKAVVVVEGTGIVPGEARGEKEAGGAGEEEEEGEAGEEEGEAGEEEGEAGEEEGGEGLDGMAAGVANLEGEEDTSKS